MKFHLAHIARNTRFAALLLPLVALLLSSCESPSNAVQLEARRAAIAAEPRGDYYIGRRFHIDRTHFWGYIRRPGEPWQNAKLVVINEKVKATPDRLPEAPIAGDKFGYDHNYEYRLKGYYSGRRIYDPNSDLKLVEFVLQDWQLINPDPGWLFKPNDKITGGTWLRAEPDSVIQR